MKRALLFIAILTGCLINAAYGHSPSDMDIYYDYNKKELTVTVYHDVLDPGNHYIKRIDLYINGRKEEPFYFDRQDDRDGLTVTIPLELYEGDEVSVEAFSTSIGSLNERLVIPPLYANGFIYYGPYYIVGNRHFHKKENMDTERKDYRHHKEHRAVRKDGREGPDGSSREEREEHKKRHDRSEENDTALYPQTLSD